MKLGANTINAINREIREQGLISKEDEIVLSINNEMQKRMGTVENIFTEMIEFLSESLNRNQLDYQIIFERYKEANRKMDKVYSNDILGQVLEEHREQMIELNTKKSQIIARFLILGCNATTKEVNNFIQLKTKQQYNKFRDIVIEDLEKNEDKILELNSICFSLISEILDRLEEENEEDIEVIDLEVKDICKYEYIDDWKEMERIALAKGYEYKNAKGKGSHRRYEHKDTKQCITIPSHDLGLGLSMKIQKQIDKYAS